MKRAEGSSHSYVGQRVDEGRRTSWEEDLPGAYHLLVETGVGGGGVANKMGGGRSEKLEFLRRSQGGGRGIGRARTSIGIHHALRPKRADGAPRWMSLERSGRLPFPNGIPGGRSKLNGRMPVRGFRISPKTGGMGGGRELNGRAVHHASPRSPQGDGQ